MNRILRPRLIIIAALLITPLVLVGCLTCDECVNLFERLCLPLLDEGNIGFFYCMFGLEFFFCFDCPEGTSTAECNSTEIVQSCIDDPEQCQEAFDAWVESFDEEASK